MSKKKWHEGLDLTGPSKMGRYYWCVKTDLSPRGDIYVNADEAVVTPNGDLVLQSERDDDRGDITMPMLCLAAGQWKAFYAASLIDGSAVAVEHWEGEVRR